MSGKTGGSDETGLKPIRVEALTSGHDRSGFQCGQPMLDDFIRQLASQHEKRNISRTFVAVEEDETRVLGYYTLANGRIDVAHLPEGRKLPRLPVPVVLLGRLAVDKSQQGTPRRLGETLLMHALWRSVLVAQNSAVYAVEVDAIDDKAAEFYRKYGFQPLLDHPLHLYLPMITIKQLGLDFSSP